MLRIIAGKYRSRVLEQPSLETTRPTLDRVREALFNILQMRIPNARVLDCFAGSGAFCLEALSRGASSAVAIEKDKRAYEIIKKNAKNLKEENIQILNSDSLTYLKNFNSKSFDFIYLDPPYKLDVLFEVMELISKNNVLSKDGEIIIETNINIEPKIPNNLEVKSIRIYGKTKLIFVVWKINNI